jgi:hypothetical protein
MMMKRSNVIIAQECNDVDDLDSLLDASIHEINFSSHSYHRDNQKFQAIFGSDKQLNIEERACETKKISTPETVPMDDASMEVSGPLVLSRRSSLNSVSGTEFRLRRQDSTISAVTFANDTELLSSEANSNKSPPNPQAEQVLNQISDSSSSTVARPSSSAMKRRSNFAREKTRSISFNETVDKVFYDNKFGSMSQTSEPLDHPDNSIQKTSSTIASESTSSSDIDISAARKEKKKEEKQDRKKSWRFSFSKRRRSIS